MLERAGEHWTIEIKLTASPTPSDMKGRDRVADLIAASRRYLISQTTTSAGDERRASCSLEWFVGGLIDGTL